MKRHGVHEIFTHVEIVVRGGVKAKSEGFG